ncbi:hypothetical protein, partial [Streptomyces sp. BE303]|uniref:hypothetical protein n=1 Tax=Streptomyces sp. BE303 TaxID=3002528 RepID=UPI002E7A193D
RPAPRRTSGRELGPAAVAGGGPHAAPRAGQRGAPEDAPPDLLAHVATGAAEQVADGAPRG